MITKNFTLTKGDSLEFTVTIEDTEIAPNDIIFIVKDNVNSTTAVIEKSLQDEEIERTEDEGYVYQIELIFGSVHETVAEGKFLITPEL